MFEETNPHATDESADWSADEPTRSVWYWPLVMASSAALLSLTGWLVLRPTPAETVTLAGILAKLEESKTLHLQLLKGSKTQDVWVKTRTLLRRDLTQNEYQVDDGQVLWTVRLDENRVTRAPSAYFAPESSELNVLGLIGIAHPQVQANLLARRPDEQAAQADAVSYRFLAPAGVGHPAMEIEVVVKASDRMLRSLRLKTVQPSGVARTLQLRVAAVNEPLDDDLFVIADTLTEDGHDPSAN